MMPPMSMLPFERPQHGTTVARCYQNIKKISLQKIKKLFSQTVLESFLLSAADALLKAGRSKLVFDFDFEILNIPSNFCGTTIAQYYQNRRKKDKCIQKNILILKY